MFGDIGHGSLLLVAAIFICIFKDKINENKDLQVLTSMRYMLLLMGIFATYMGLIYNDFLSLPLSLFGKSCYEVQNGVNVRSS
jgi:V-type H+-transporting ATPase subunit a